VNLKELNLTRNDLYGRLPDGLLRKFGEKCFSGNERLYMWVEPVGELLVQGRSSGVCFVSDNSAVEPELVA
jgi:hypothetical protein